MDREFWRGKRVVITGNTGFKGSWLSMWLHALGAKVTGYALAPPSQPSLFKTAGLKKVINSIEGDIRNLNHMDEFFKKHDPDIIIHMAAQALVRESYTDPVDTYATNVMGTVNVLEAARNLTNLRVIIIVTSDKCYENQEWHWGYRENEPMGGYDPYSSSKGCAELVTAAYHRSFFSKNKHNNINVATVRAGNVIGGGDWAKDRLIPDLMDAFLEKKKLTIRYPQAIRPWQHVLEPLNGYMLLAEKLWEPGDNFSGGWNFGADDKDAQTVAWITKRLASLWDGQLEWEEISDTSQQPHEAVYLKLDCSKAKALLGWSPVLDLDKVLLWIVDWYKAYQQNADMLEVCLDEISKYQQLLD